MARAAVLSPSAVGRGLGHDLGADDGVGAGAVVDDDRLTPVLIHLLRDTAKARTAKPMHGGDTTDASRRAPGGCGVMLG